MMSLKNSLIIAAFLLTGFNVNAQKFFIQPYAGAGITGVTGIDYNISHNKKHYQNRFTNTVGINAGRSFGRFQLSIGAGFLTTGFKLRDLQMANPHSAQPFRADTVDIHVSHRNIFGAISAGYTVVKRKRFSVTPILSVAPSYIAKSQSVWKYQSDKADVKHTIKDPGNPYPTVALLGIGAIQCAWDINNHIAITFSPSFYYTLNPMMQNTGGDERNYAITGNVGVLLRL